MIKYEFQYYSIINYSSIGSNFIVVVLLDGVFVVTRQLCGNDDDYDNGGNVMEQKAAVLFVVKIQTIVKFLVFPFSLLSRFFGGVAAGIVRTTINYILRVTNSFRNEKCFARLHFAPRSICIQSQNAEAVAFPLLTQTIKINEL